MWNRCALNANGVHWRQRSRQFGRGIFWYLCDEQRSWFQLCECRTLEDVRHVLGWCAHAAYMEIRASWFEQVKVKAQELTPALWKAIRAGLRCRDGAFKAVGSQPVEA